MNKPAKPGAARPVSSPPPSPIVLTRTTFPDPIFEGEPLKSIIHPDFSGLNLVTGFRGKGKTSWLLKLDRPENICMIDCEDKGITLAGPLGVGAYFQPMTDVCSLLGKDFEIQAAYDRIAQVVNKIPAGRFTTLIIDNAQDLQDGAARLIQNNPSIANRYGVRPENAISGGYGGSWPGVKHLVAELLHLTNSKGIKVIGVSFQLKPAWKDGKPLFNQFKTTDVAIWHERSILTLIFVDPMAIHYPVPRALVMKESLSVMEWSEELQETLQYRRIPQALPCAKPVMLYRYLDNRTGKWDPQEGETVTALELAPYLPTFSREQLVELEKMVRAQKALGILDDVTEE